MFSEIKDYIAGVILMRLPWQHKSIKGGGGVGMVSEGAMKKSSVVLSINFSQKWSKLSTNMNKN